MPNTKRIITLGLTGNISAGKSTVLGMFEKLGCKIFSTDKITNELLKDEKIRSRISRTLGIDKLNPQDLKAQLADIVFNSKTKRKQLEKIIHPEISEIIDSKIKKLPRSCIAIIEVPLLFESKWNKKVNVTVLVKCPRELRKKRYYSKKGTKKGEFERREKAQWNERKKEALADLVIDNSKGLAQTKKQVKALLQVIRL